MGSLYLLPTNPVIIIIIIDSGPRPLHASHSTAYGAQVIRPLDYMGRHLSIAFFCCGLFFDYGVFAHFVHILPVTPEVSSRVSKSGPVGWVI